MEEEKIIFRYEMSCGEIIGLFLPPAMSVKIINRTENNVLLYEFKNDLNSVFLPFICISDDCITLTVLCFLINFTRSLHFFFPETNYINI